MDELIEKIVQLAIENKWDEVFNILEKEPPHVFDRALHEYCIRTACDTFGENLTDGQSERCRWLDSSERRIEYYNSIPEDEMTDEDWADFKASAW